MKGMQRRKKEVNFSGKQPSRVEKSKNFKINKIISYKGFLVISDDQKIPYYEGFIFKSPLFPSETLTNISILEASLGRLISC